MESRIKNKRVYVLQPESKSCSSAVFDSSYNPPLTPTLTTCGAVVVLISSQDLCQVVMFLSPGIQMFWRSLGQGGDPVHRLSCSFSQHPIQTHKVPFRIAKGLLHKMNTAKTTCSCLRRDGLIIIFHYLFYILYEDGSTRT